MSLDQLARRLVEIVLGEPRPQTLDLDEALIDLRELVVDDISEPS